MDQATPPHQPGQEIRPSAPPQAPQQPVQPPVQQPAVAAPVQQAAAPQPQLPQVAAQPQQPAEPIQSPGPHPDAIVSWESSEYAGSERSGVAYAAVAAGGIGLGVLVFVVTSDIFSGVAVVAAVLAFVIFGMRRPQTLRYQLFETGVMIDQKFHDFGRFKAFAVDQDQAHDTIYLQPLSRVSPGISLHLPFQESEEVINVLSNFLPFDQSAHDRVDAFMRRLKF